MKKSGLAEIKKMDIKALKEKIKVAKSELVGIVLNKSINKEPNLKAAKAKRLDVAQMLTVLRQKELLSELGEVNGK